MAIAMPKPGTYRRLADGTPVQVTGCTGSHAMATVTVRTTTPRRTWHVQLGNFWRKYEEA